jgi:ribosomal protein L11 methyltransferase
MQLATLDPERVESAFTESGALSVTFTDGGDDPVLEPAPGETPLWSDTVVTALFDDNTDLRGLEERLSRSLDVDALPAHRLETLADRVWEREWLRDFGPMRFGQRLWIVPGEETDVADDAVVVRLDPGLAFGTGTHPTTAMCLEWLDACPLAGKSVFDFGCGSGILSVAALKLGASSVCAVDNDPQAVTATGDNATRNDVVDGLDASLEFPRNCFDVVLANILAGTLIEFAERLCEATKPGGAIALSGILEDQVEDVRQAFEDNVVFDAPMRRGDWALLSGKRT